MQTYISILRGINVSGQKMIRMEALRDLYDSLLLKDVQTYIQSGNVIFRAANSSEKELELGISNAIKDRFGFDVPALVLPVGEFERIVAGNPFAGVEGKDEAFMHVTFFADLATAPDRSLLDAKLLPGEEFSVGRRAVYLYCPQGYGKTKLNNNFLERVWQVSATTRNWCTVNELLSLARKISALD